MILSLVVDRASRLFERISLASSEHDFAEGSEEGERDREMSRRLWEGGKGFIFPAILRPRAGNVTRSWGGSAVLFTTRWIDG